MNIVRQMQQMSRGEPMAPVTVSRSSLTGTNPVRQMQQMSRREPMVPISVSRSSLTGGTNVVRQMQQMSRGEPMVLQTQQTTRGRAAIVLDTRAGMPGTTSIRQGRAQTGIAAGGTALARGSSAIGVVPSFGAGAISLGTPATAGTGVAAGGTALGGVTDEINKVGGEIMNTVTQYIPLAIKVLLAVIAIKIVFWLLRGRR